MTESNQPSNERLPFRWERDPHCGKWRLTTYDMGDGLVAGYEHVAGYYESRLIDEIERLNAQLAQYDWVFEDADKCAGIVADAYKGWDPDKPWRDALIAEINYRDRSDIDRDFDAIDREQDSPRFGP